MNECYRLAYRAFTRIASGVFSLGNAAYGAAHWFYVKANK